ncbi:MAG: hypothetical protein IPH75_07545 [bacterium]|nr:hypothetical protein [bacterium]
MYRIFMVLGLILLSAWPVSADLSVSGMTDIVFKNADNDDYTNITFKKHSPFHTLRTRLFFDATLSENSSAFLQLMTDNNSVIIYGAYIRFTNLAGKYVNLQAGYIPTTVGSFGARVYSDKNPLIGTPLVFNHHSNLVGFISDSMRSVAQLLGRRDTRYNLGLPVVYDACWNTGAEMYGSVGKLDYSLSLLSGAVSLPTLEQYKDVPQVTSKLNYYFNPGFMIGAAGFYGPYLSEYVYGDEIPEGHEYVDYMNAGAGYDFYWSSRYLEVFSESYWAMWEHPYLPDLSVTSGYFEAKYKLAPGWYLAGRYDYFEPGTVTTESGSEEKWDYPLKRYEFGIGHRLNRQALLKLVTQLNRCEMNSELDVDLYAMQLSISF